MTDTENPFAAWEHNFREQLLWLREARGMTQTDLAKLLKARYKLPFHQQTIQRIESGDRPVRLNEAHLIAKVLDVELDSMTADSGAPSDREMRFAVDRLRGQAGVREEEILETLGEWVEGIESLAVMVNERGLYVWSSDSIPEREMALIPESELPAMTRWGLAWAFKAQRAFRELYDAHYSLGAIHGGADELERAFEPGAMMDGIARWAEAYPTVVEDSRRMAFELYAAYPGSDDGQH